MDTAEAYHDARQLLQGYARVRPTAFSAAVRGREYEIRMFGKRKTD